MAGLKKCLKKKTSSFYIRTRIPVVSHSLYLKNIPWNQRYPSHQQQCHVHPPDAIQGLELPLPQKAIFGKNPGFSLKDAAFPLVQKPVLTTNHCSIPEKEISSQHARDYMEILKNMLLPYQLQNSHQCISIHRISIMLKLKDQKEIWDFICSCIDPCCKGYCSRNT